MSTHHIKKIIYEQKMAKLFSKPLSEKYGKTLKIAPDVVVPPTKYEILLGDTKTSGVALSTVPTSWHFDHLFGTGSYRINRYAFFKDTDHLDLLTDHPFVYADLAF